MDKTKTAKLTFFILLIIVVLVYSKLVENPYSHTQTQCEKIEEIARNQIAVKHLDSWIYEHVIDKGYNFVSGINGRIWGSKGDEYFIITPLPKEKVTGIELNFFRLSLDKITDDVEAEITTNNVGQIDFGRGRDKVIILKNGAELKSYRGHDESSGHILKISNSVFAYCANAKFEI